MKTLRAVTVEQVRRMRELAGQGLGYGRIAERLGLSYSSVERYLSGRKRATATPTATAGKGGKPGG